LIEFLYLATHKHKKYSEFIAEDSEGSKYAAVYLLPSGAGYMLDI